MIYLDYNATAPLRVEALAAMEQAAAMPGNPSSLHVAGRAARRRLDGAADAMRELVGAGATCEVVITGSGSEANALALLGLARRAAASGRRRLLIGAVEHPCIARAAELLSGEGVVVERLPVRASGAIDVEVARARLGTDVGLLAVMLANNETGVLMPVRELALAARQHGVYVHTDAVQAVGKVRVRFDELGVSSLALAAHKFGGPKGVGALVLAPGVSPEPLWHGGPQERGLRAGTQPVVLAVGMAAAARAALTELAVGEPTHGRDALEAGCRAIGDALVVGEGAARLPNTCAVGFRGVSAGALVRALDARGVAVGAGSACHSGEGKPSAVLTAMGLAPERAREVVRLSTGFLTTPAEIAAALAALSAAVAAAA